MIVRPEVLAFLVEHLDVDPENRQGERIKRGSAALRRVARSAPRSGLRPRARGRACRAACRMINMCSRLSVLGGLTDFLAARFS